MAVLQGEVACSGLASQMRDSSMDVWCLQCSTGFGNGFPISLRWEVVGKGDGSVSGAGSEPAIYVCPGEQMRGSLNDKIRIGRRLDLDG